MRKLGIALAVLLNLSALLLYAALRDREARPAVGERRVARPDGGRLHYFAAGPEDGAVVALFPGYARSASDFNELVSALNQAGHRTLALQPRGVDGSALSFPDDLHGYAEDLRAMLDAEDVTRPVVVCGHAYGNRVARSFASRFPDRTRGLVLLAAGGADPTPPEMTRAIGRAMLGVWPEGTRRAATERAFFAKGHPVPDAWMRGWYPLAGLAQSGANQTPWAEWGAGGSAPVLVVQPAEDAVAPRGGPELARRFPERVTLVSVPRAGHALLPEQPEAVARAVLAFLGSLP
ncbi:MAG: alpha/beta fold hydrolase [Myxococcota bacterium]